MNNFLRVVTSYGEKIDFTDGEVPEVDPTSGRLYVSLDGRDIAVFNIDGWAMFARPPELEAEEEEDDGEIEYRG